MNVRLLLCFVSVGALLSTPAVVRGGSKRGASASGATTQFHTSDRCVACHNGLKTSSGEDISIGFQWRAGIMANSARDPYWQASVRRETIDHPESTAAIEDECSTCHMPITHLTAKSENRQAEIFAYLPLSQHKPGVAEAADGVSCSVCHQIEPAGLGTPQTFNGNVVIAPAKEKDQRPEYGPFDIDAGHQQIMHSSTGGFIPQLGPHISDAALCGSCHTLITTALGPGGKNIGNLHEQMPFQEWQHSEYVNKQTCQSCHMPEVQEAVAVTSLYGQPRLGMHRHEFTGGNFFLQRLLNAHRDELSVTALAQELSVAADRSINFLQTQSARVSIDNLQSAGDAVSFNVRVVNLTGHKLPTAYPSRRAWLHITVWDAQGQKVFESGALNPDGSIAGNDNDSDPHRYEPHYREITSPGQVQIFEPILSDSQGKVTTGLIAAIGYLKDNRLLPHGFDKASAPKEIAVVGDAADDPNFTDQGAVTRYVVSAGKGSAGNSGPYRVEAELWYQPIGFRWAHNLEPYNAFEPQRFVNYYKSAAQHSAVVLAKTGTVTK